MGYEIDFLSVGEGEKGGDAITMRFGNLFGERKEQTVIVIDGGFKESGKDLVEHIRKYYKTNLVDLVISTHPDSDHADGLEVVLENLEVNCLWMHLPWNHTDDIAKMFKDGRVTDNSVREALRKSLDTARSLERIAERKGIPTLEPFNGLKDDSGHCFVLSPTETFYEELLPGFRGTPEQESARDLLERAASGVRETYHKVVESLGHETLDDSGETSPENNSSVVFLFYSDEEYALFTGDAGIPALMEAANHLDYGKFDFSTLKFIQVPHHGSRRNIGPYVLDRIIGFKQTEYSKKMTAFLSAPKNGLPKHPAKKVTNAFRRRGAPVYASMGKNLRHRNNAPDRERWTAAEPLPLYREVDE